MIQYLVIEDEDAIRRGICDLLAFHGMEPVGAATGDDGLRQARAGLWDLLLVDVMLPGVDGFTICRSVREESIRGRESTAPAALHGHKTLPVSRAGPARANSRSSRQHV